MTPTERIDQISARLTAPSPPRFDVGAWRREQCRVKAQMLLPQLQRSIVETGGRVKAIARALGCSEKATRAMIRDANLWPMVERVRAAHAPADARTTRPVRRYRKGSKWQ